MNDLWLRLQQLLGKRSAFALALTVVVVGGLGAVKQALDMREEGQRVAQARFDQLAERLDAAVQSRFEKPLYGLKGLRAHMVANPNANNTSAQAWVRARDVALEFPGVRGIGWIEPTARRDLATFTDRVRAASGDDFRVNTGGDKPDLFVITAIEPIENNRPAWGLDVGREPVRREAIERAARTGQAALTGVITLLQDGQRRPGYLFVLPVYRSGVSAELSGDAAMGLRAESPEERLASVRGFVYAPIVAEELLRGVLDGFDGQLDLQVFDGADAPDTAHLVFDFSRILAGAQGAVPESLYQSRSFHGLRQVRVGGRVLTLSVSTAPAFDLEMRRDTPWLTGAVVFGVSLLLGLVVWLLGSSQARAVAAAETMTQELRVSSAREAELTRHNRALLDTLNTHALVSVADAEGRMLEVNDAYCALAGYPREKLIGQTHRFLNSGVHPPEFWRALWDCVRAGRPWRGQICNRNAAGELFWVDTMVVPVMNGQGEPERYIAIRFDITRAKALEAELIAKGERFNLALDGSSDGLWECWLGAQAADSGWWSPQFYRLLGLAPDAVKPCWSWIEARMHVADRPTLAAALLACQARGEGLDIELRLLVEGQDFRWFALKGKPFDHETPERWRLAGSLQDIHDRRLAQQQAQAQAAHLSDILALSPDGFVALEPGRGVRYVSPAFETLTGLAATGLLQQSAQHLISALLGRCAPTARVRSLDDLRSNRALSGQAAPTRHLLELAFPQQRMLELRLLESHRSGTDQEHALTLLHVRDVTHETEVDRMKSEFLSTAAHELRTPMASIYGFSELLATRELSPERQKGLFTKIHRQSEAMVRILNELLDLARIEARRGEDFQRELLNLDVVVREAVADFLVPDDRQAPELTVEEGEHLVNVDKQKLQQVLRNLLSNAFKYSPEGGPVEVAVFIEASTGAAATPRVGVEVRDHGIGMSPEALHRVTERFFRVDASGAIPGTGLGMSIVKEIVHLHGGALDMTSTPGVGTTVTVWLPLAQEPSA